MQKLKKLKLNMYNFLNRKTNRFNFFVEKNYSMNQNIKNTNKKISIISFSH